MPEWTIYDPDEFRERIISFCGADNPEFIEDPIKLPAPDDAILNAIVEAAGPDSLRLERDPDRPTTR